MKRIRLNIVAVEKHKNYILLSVCVCVCVALVTQHTMHMHRILLLSVACPGPSFFPYYITNSAILEKKKKLLNIRFVFVSLEALSEKI
jgi:hypothetical protein